jgi:hypothetical protein
MIDKTLQQNINNKFKDLPTKIQRAITHSGWEQKIRNIAKKYDLVIGEAGVLETETFLIMLGLESPENYRANIKNGLNIDDEKANAIIKKVDEEIFKEIKSDLIELNENEKKDIDTAQKNKEVVEDVTVNTTTADLSSNETQQQTKEDITKEMSDSGLEILKNNENEFEKINSGDIIAENMTSSSIINAESHDIQDPVETEEPNKGPKFDPYREPIDLDN